MARKIKIYKCFIKQWLKSLIEYRVDFAIGMISFVIQQLAGLLFLFVILSAIPNLNGWNFNHLVFIYGVYLIPRGIDHIFTDNLWSVGHFVRSGEFDMFLLRPLGTLFQLISQKLDWNGVAELITGIAMLVVTWNQANVALSGAFDIFVFSIYLFTGTLIYSFIKLIFASFSFKTKNSFAIMYSGYSFSEYAKYPITIYPNAIKFVITFILPFAFTSYYPAAYALGIDQNINHLYASIGVLTGLMIMGTILWKWGIKSYESSGS